MLKRQKRQNRNMSYKYIHQSFNSRSKERRKNAQKKKKLNRNYQFDRYHESQVEEENKRFFQFEDPISEISRFMCNTSRRRVIGEIRVDRSKLIKISKKNKMNFSVSRFIDIMKNHNELFIDLNNYSEIRKNREEIKKITEETILMLKREWEINKLGF